MNDPQQPTSRVSRFHFLKVWVTEPRWRWLSAGAAFSLVLLLLPVWSDQTTVSWNGAATRAVAPTVVTVAPPTEFTAKIGCPAFAAMDSAAELTPQNVLSTSPGDPGAIQVTYFRGAVTATTGLSDANVPTLPIDSHSSCEVTVAYNEAQSLLTLSDGNASKSQHDPYPQRSEAGADELPVGPVVTTFSAATAAQQWTQVSMTLFPSTIDWPWWRLGLLALSLFCVLVAALGINRLGDLRSWLRRVVNVLRPQRVDFAVLGVLALIWIIRPPLNDDGWVLVTNRAFPDIGFFSNYFSISGAPQVQGAWWSLLSQVTRVEGAPVWLMRLPSILLVWFTWIAIRKLIVIKLATSKQVRIRATWLAGVAMLTSACAWLPSLRPEVVTGICLAFSLILTLRYNGDWNARRFTLLAFIAALAFTEHQTGLMVVGVLVVALGDVIQQRGLRDSLFSELIPAIASFLISTVALLMLFSNLTVFTQASAAFASAGSHNRILDELQRGAQVISSPSGLQVLSVIIVWVALGLSLLTWHRYDARCRRLTVANGVALTMLTLTSSKWIGHYAATWPIAVCLFTLFVTHSPTLSVRSARLLSLCGSIGAGLIMAIAYAGTVLGMFTDRRALPTKTVGTVIGLVVLVAVLWTVTTWLSRRTTSAPPHATNALILALGISVLGGLIGPWLTVQSTETASSGEGWNSYSWPKISLTSFASDQCGVLHDLQVVGNPAPLPTFMNDKGNVRVGTDPRLITTKVSPYGNLDVQQAPSGSPTGVAPYYGVIGTGSIQWWVAANSNGTSVNVEFVDTFDKPTQSVPITHVGRAGTWQLMRVNVPADAKIARLVFSSQKGVEAVTPIVSADSKDLVPADSLVTGDLWRNAGEGLLSSCHSMPDISEGIFSTFDWSLGQPTIAPTGGSITPWAHSRPMTEVSCIGQPDGTAPLCLYWLSRSSQFGLSHEQEIVRRGPI